jgi:hypothetical protein
MVSWPLHWVASHSTLPLKLNTYPSEVNAEVFTFEKEAVSDPVNSNCTNGFQVCVSVCEGHMRSDKPNLNGKLFSVLIGVGEQRVSSRPLRGVWSEIG